MALFFQLHLKSERNQGKFLSILNIIQGEIEPTQVRKALQRIKERKLVEFVDWCPVNFQVTAQSVMQYLALFALQVAVSNGSSFVAPTSRVRGLLLANHTRYARKIVFSSMYINVAKCS